MIRHFLVFFAFFWAAVCQAGSEVTAVFVPRDSTQVDGAALRAWMVSQPGVLRADAVFGQSESQFLTESGQAGLAGSLKLRLRDAEAMTSLKRALRRKGSPRGKLDLNESMKMLSRDPSHLGASEQWGVRNSGKDQEIELTDILVRRVRGAPGEDAGLAAAPAEKPDRKTLIAVLDTGVEGKHPALQGRLFRSPKECQALEAYRECMRTQADKEPCHAQYANSDSDGNGYPLDCSGWNFLGPIHPKTGLTGDNEPEDDIGHGTHVAGIIAGTGFIQGAASQVEILPVKVLGKGESGAASAEGDVPDPHSPELTQPRVFADGLARGILYAVRSHAQVINMSLGYPLHDDSELMRRMVALAQSRGVLVVAAAGNQSSLTPVYPCRYAGVICVASHSADGAISHFSDFGDATDIAAPGHKILSAWLTSQFPSFFTERKGYDFKSGTSMAAPFVSAALGRLLNAGFSPEESYARMMLGARPSRPPTAVEDLAPKFTMAGNLDLSRAVAVIPSPLILPEIKEPLLIALERTRGTGEALLAGMRFELALKNFWQEAQEVRVALKVEGRAARFLRPAPTSATFKETAWKQGERRVLKGEFEFIAGSSFTKLPGEFYLALELSGKDLQGRAFTRTVMKQAEFVVPVRPIKSDALLADASIHRIATDVTAASLQGDYSMKPISCLGGASELGPEMLIIQQQPTSTILQVLSARPADPSRPIGAKVLRRTDALLLDSSRERLIAFSCLDFVGDGTRRTAALIFDSKDKKFVFKPLGRRGPPPAVGAPSSVSPSSPTASLLQVSGDTVVVPEELRWLRGEGSLLSAGDARGLVPTWISRGRKPESKKPVFDPWEWRPAEALNTVETRMYVMTASGIKIVEPPEGLQYVGFLKGTQADLASGTATALFFKGQNFILDFYTAKISAMRWSAPVPLEQSVAPRLAVSSALPFIGSSNDGGAAGMAFTDTSSEGRMRLSLLDYAGPLRSSWIEALQPGDLLNRVLGVFWDGSRYQSFYRSRFNLYYRDEARGATQFTNLRQYDSVNRHLPVRAAGLPALLLPEGQGGSLTAEVIVAADAELDGRAPQELERPALYKTLGVGGCEPVNPASTSANGAGLGMSDVASRLLYFCGDHFVEVAL